MYQFVFPAANNSSCVYALHVEQDDVQCLDFGGLVGGFVMTGALVGELDGLFVVTGLGVGFMDGLPVTGLSVGCNEGLIVTGF